mmetsp:Transcript_29876/g.55999  ORF Transcript_29876/g.55999 Transcript_29876/m.55999 type:complete len:469 (-) Transcript_29876:261-1667(-)
MAESKDVSVVLTLMSGAEVELQMQRDDSVQALRHAAAQALGVSTWQLRLALSDGSLAKGGSISSLMGPEEDHLDVTAVTLKVRWEVTERSRELSLALGKRYDFYRMAGMVHFRHTALAKFRDDILEGDVQFDYQGNNLLELAVSNVSADQAPAVAKLFMDGGADLNGRSRDGYTPLLSACSRGLAKVADELVQRGARRTEILPGGDTALKCALRFFKACLEHKSMEREEDLELARFCCSLRSHEIELALKAGLTSLAAARLQLSDAATRLALLGPTGVVLRQEDVLRETGLPESLVAALGEQLWEGWPHAFLTFGLDVPARAESFEDDFTSARSRVLYYRASSYQPKCSKGMTRQLSYVSADSEEYFTEYLCDCPVCCPELNRDLSDFAEEVKSRNRKWQEAQHSDRGCKRVPIAGRSRKASYSARLAKKMPAAYRGYHVEHAMHGGRKKLRKFQLVQEQLRMDTCPL